MQTLTYGEHLSRYLAVSKIVEGKNVLDVASGAGYGSQMLAKEANSVEGLDYSKDAVVYARKNFPAKNLTYSIGDALNMPYDDNVFDVVVSLETIEHLPDPDKFISEVKRVLKPNGLLIVSTPNDDEFMDGNEFHIHEFQFTELDRLIKTNFSKYNYYYQGTYFAASLFKQDEFTKGFDEKQIIATATFGQPTKKAIYFLAIASNAKDALPELESNLIIADRWSTKDDIERDSARVQHIDTILNDTKALSTRIDELSEEFRNVSKELDDVRNSKSWKLISKVRSVKNALAGRAKG